MRDTGTWAWGDMDEVQKRKSRSEFISEREEKREDEASDGKVCART